MTDREKVVKNLQAIDAYFRESFDTMGGTLACELFREWSVAAEEAIALLKAQEPRAMSIGDLYGYDMGFYERRDEELVWPVLISRGGPDDDETVGFVRKDGYELRSDCGLMNITWRIWTAYPSHELREVTPWQ